MSCFLNEQNGTVEAVLSFKRNQLLYDIANCAYIEGHVMETENTHRHHMVQDVAEEGNVDRVTRVLDLNVAKCREMLYPFIKHEIHRHELDDILKETPVYGMVLKVPQDFSQTTLNLLERLIHEFLVCKSLADWMSITNPDKAQTWDIKAQEAERGIRSGILSRLRRVRRRSHPF
jgi:hypothetical protein